MEWPVTTTIRAKGAILHDPHRLPAIHAGEREVHDDDCRRLAPRFRERLVGGRRRVDPQPRVAEVVRVHLAVVGDVVDDEDERGVRSGSCLSFHCDKRNTTR
jgi:hypothetical protein